MFRKLIFTIIGIVILAFLAYSYVYRDHRNIAQEKPVMVVDANRLATDFKENIEMAEEKYLNKTIAVKGEVTTLNSNSLILDNVVFCAFTKFPKTIEMTEQVSIKGRCIGFDNLLGEVKLDQCSIY